MTDLTHAHSPLAQTRKHRRVRIAGRPRSLSPQRQAALARLLDGKYEHIHHPLFDLPEKEAMQRIFEQGPDIPKPDTSWYRPVVDHTRERRADTGTSMVLTSEQEQALFLQFNYCRLRTVQLREQLQQQRDIDPALGRETLAWFDKAEAYRHQIAQTNLALVLAMAKRTRMSEVDFSDLVSEGNMALLRAVDKFDASRGFKFSTYACRAILKAFSRSGVKLSKHRQLFPTDFDPALEKSNYMEKKREAHEADCVDEVRQIIRSNQADLSDIEQEVIQHRFAINKQQNQNDESEALTLEQVGRIIGVTKERVRQIQNKALEKIRLTLEVQYLR